MLEGWFLYAEGGTRKDGKDDSSKAALPPSLSEQHEKVQISSQRLGNTQLSSAAIQ